MNTILFIGAHPDDEFACSATISKFVEAGSIVHMLYFSICEDIVPPGFSKNIRIKEIEEAALELGVSKDKLILYTFPVRRLDENRSTIRQRLYNIGNELNPDVILIPSRFDVHQDHKTVSEEAIRTLRFQTILGYELPRNIFFSELNYFEEVTEEQLKKKVLSLSKHTSESFRKYFDPEVVYSLARVRGMQANVKFAEAFESIRVINK